MSFSYSMKALGAKCKANAKFHQFDLQLNLLFVVVNAALIFERSITI